MFQTVYSPSSSGWVTATLRWIRSSTPYSTANFAPRSPASFVDGLENAEELEGLARLENSDTLYRLDDLENVEDKAGKTGRHIGTLDDPQNEKS